MALEGFDAAAAAARRNEALAAALSKHLANLNLDPKRAAGEQDILELFTSALQVADGGGRLKSKDELMKWVAFARDFPAGDEARHAVLKGLNEELSSRSVLVGAGLKSSEADVVVFSVLHPFVVKLLMSDKQKYPNVMRWMDYIQNIEDLGGAFEKIMFEKATFKHIGIKNAEKLDISQTLKKATQVPKIAETPAVDSLPKSAPVNKVSADGKSSGDKKKVSEKVSAESKPTEEKKKAPAKETVKDLEVSVSALNIQVGIIRKAWKHPSADSLLVEEIDIGGGIVRQVVSGLAKYCSPDDLVNRSVALITNVKPGKLRDVMSSGLVLCASSQDHTVVEPLLPPKGAVPGERISFSGYDGQPEEVLNPKKKQLEKITPDLYTDDKGVATYKGVPFMTSAGPCRSSIPKASIK